MIDALKKLLAPSETPPTAKAVEEVRLQVGQDLAAARDELRSLRAQRPEVLVAGTDQEITAHDEQIQAIERQVEALEARGQALANRVKELELAEAVAEMPQRIEQLAAALEAHEEAARAADRARGELVKIAGDVSMAWTKVAHRRPSDLRLLPVVPRGLQDRIEAIVNVRLSLNRPEPRDPDEPRAVFQAGRGWRFEGEWTPKQQEAFSQSQHITHVEAKEMDRLTK